MSLPTTNENAEHRGMLSKTSAHTHLRMFLGTKFNNRENKEKIADKVSPGKQSDIPEQYVPSDLRSC